MGVYNILLTDYIAYNKLHITAYSYLLFKYSYQLESERIKIRLIIFD